MTIIRPAQHRGYLRFMVSIFALVILGGAFYIYQYNVLAEGRYEVTDIKNRIVEAEVLNAELKKAVYQIIDPAELEALAGVRQLVLEYYPEYLDTSQWVSDSSY